MRLERKGKLVWVPFVLFSLIGGLMLVADDVLARLFGGIILLFFGGGGLVFFWVTRPRKPLADEEVLARIVEGPVGGADGVALAPQASGVKLLASRRAFVPIVLGSAIFVVTSLFLVLWPFPFRVPWAEGLRRPAGAFGALFFLGTLGAALRGMLQRAGLAFLPQGLLSVQPTGRAFVPWDELGGVWEHRQAAPSQVQHYLAVAFTTPPPHDGNERIAASRIRLTGWLARIRKLQRNLHGFDVSIQQRLPLSNPEVVRLVDRLLEDPDLRQRLDRPGAAELVFALARDHET